MVGEGGGGGGEKEGGDHPRQGGVLQGRCLGE